MDSQAKPQRCPFCCDDGARAIGDSPCSRWVSCPSCDASGPVEASDPEAIAAWNDIEVVVVSRSNPGKTAADAVARLQGIQAAFKALVASPHVRVSVDKVSEDALWTRLCGAIGVQAPMPHYDRRGIAARLLAKRYWQFCAAESAEEMATTFDRLEAALGDYCAAQRLIPEQNTRDLTLDD